VGRVVSSLRTCEWGVSGHRNTCACEPCDVRCPDWSALLLVLPGVPWPMRNCRRDARGVLDVLRDHISRRVVSRRVVSRRVVSGRVVSGRVVSGRVGDRTHDRQIMSLTHSSLASPPALTSPVSRQHSLDMRISHVSYWHAHWQHSILLQFCVPKRRAALPPLSVIAALTRLAS
jgi:hypothetical protein